jgi:hypothetical protein
LGRVYFQVPLSHCAVAMSSHVMGALLCWLNLVALSEVVASSAVAPF